jgi:hypothetical protein
MSSKYNFDKKIATNTHTIEVDTAACYGWFENDASGSGGGLWFDLDASAPDGSTRMKLVDYDGVDVLPMKVIIALRGAGFIVTEDFE